MQEFTLSQTAATLQRSVMRDLMALAVSPDILSLAGGLPASEVLPVREFSQSLERVLQRDGARAMQYGPPYMPLREWIAGYMQKKGVDCTAENIFITNGAQQSLAILSRLFCDPGDAAVIEAITFTGVQQVTLGRRLQVHTVATDLESGVDVEALEHAFRTYRPKLAILIPNFHNPMGVTISLEKRERIVELAAQYRVPVVEDDPYSPLRFMGEAMPPLKALDRDGMVFYIGSFSKMLMPAARLGWIVGPKELADRITVLRESIDLESSQLIQRAVHDFLDNGRLGPYLDRLNSTNLRRRRELMQALETHFAPLGARWTRPEGGLFAWVTLPEEIDAWQQFEQAVEQKVAYIPGAAFAVRGGHRNTLRLNFSNIADGDITEAISRLARVFSAH